MASSIHFAELCFLGASLTAVLLGALLQRQHLRECPRIAADVHMYEFKGFVRLQMYLTILALAAMIPALLLLFRRTFFGDGFDPIQGLVWLLPYIVLFAFSLMIKRKGIKVRDVNRCDEKYREDFAHVSFVWRKKVFPNF